MKKIVLIPVVLVAAVAAAAPGGATAAPSCVGQFSSTFATREGRTFGAEISSGAQFASEPNFGAGMVAPFAHEPRDICP